jgi:hypothetical protein
MYNFPDAQEYAKKLNDFTGHGHFDWRVPTQAELGVLFTNRVPVGEFEPAGWYWSSSQDRNDAWGQHFTDGGLFRGRRAFHDVRG